MKGYDLLELSARNLREAVLRNSLTTLGIGVGIASLVAMMSLGIGLQQLFNRELGRSSLFDSVFVTSRQDSFRRQKTQGPPPKSLDDAARKAFSGISGVLEVYPNLIAIGEFVLDNGKPAEPHLTALTGLPPTARSSEAFEDMQGSFFSGPDAAEVIVMAEFGRELLGLPEQPVNSDQKLTPEQSGQLLGKTLVLRYAERQSQITPEEGAPPPDSAAAGSSSFNVVRKEKRLKIVGVVTSEPVRGIPRTGRTSAFLPIAFAESLNMIQPGDLRNVMRAGEGKTYSALIVRVNKSNDVAPVEEQIKLQGFNAFSLLDAARNIRVIFTFVYLFLWIFGSLALVVASLGIVNTLVMAILERRREIGIMKAIGASDGDVKMIFFVEAGSMGLAGGSLGVLMGWLIGRVINFGTNIYLRRQDLMPTDFWYVTWWLVAGALLFSVIVSLFAGLYPASRAAKLDPVEALRHD